MKPTTAILSLFLITTFGGLATAAEPVAGGAQWGYTGATSPEHWGGLSPAYATCKNGTRQSPIDLKNPISAQLAPLKISYNNGVIDVLDHDDQTQADHGHGNFITIGRKKYLLYQIHFHDPSEHTINGKAYAAEAHLVHKGDDGSLAVIGVLIDKGRASPAIAELPDKEHPDHVSIKAALLVPKGRAAFRYNGSLTTPGCGEGVLWTVFKARILMSQEQIDGLTEGSKSNARPIQPSNGRFILQGR